MDNLFGLPEFHVLNSGNPYPGSLRGLRYYLAPGEQLVASVWTQDHCYEVACERGEIVAQEQFPRDEPGYHQAIEWLTERYHELIG